MGVGSTEWWEHWLEWMGSGQFAKWLQQQWILSKCKKPCKLSGGVVWSTLDFCLVGLNIKTVFLLYIYHMNYHIALYTRDQKARPACRIHLKEKLSSGCLLPRGPVSTISNPIFGEGIANNFSVWWMICWLRWLESILLINFVCKVGSEPRPIYAASTRNA